MLTKFHSVSSIPSYKYRYGGIAKAGRMRYRHGGNGFFSNLLGSGSQFMGETIKNLINSTSKAQLKHKVSSALIDGAAQSLQPKKLVAHATTFAVNKLIEKINKRKKKKKKKNKKEKEEYKQQLPTSSYIEQVINSGKGIVYD